MENIKVPENAKFDDIVITGVERLRIHERGKSGSLVFVSFDKERNISININDGYLEITI